jgi:hydrogenase-4 component F
MTLVVLLLIPLAAGLLCLTTRSRKSWEMLNLVAFVLLVPLTIETGAEVLAVGPISALDGFLRADALSVLVIGLTVFVAVVCGVYAIGYFREDTRAGRITDPQLRRYYVLTPLFVALMLLVPLADNLGVMWVATESTTLASVLLVTFYSQKTSFEAGWKYIIIGSIGISLALFGTIFTYYSAARVLGEDTRHGMNWSALVAIANTLDPRAMRLAFVLILLGYGTKAGLAPMHTWKPDAYSEAPVPTATLLGAAFVNCAVYGIARFNIIADKCLGHEFPGHLLAGFGVASILVAAPFILTQRNFRRILAYSSIDHAGIIVAGLGFGGKLGALGASLHILFHGVTKPLMFFCAGNVQQHFATPFFGRVRGVMRTLPWTGGLFLLGTLAVTGTPPFSIFQSEFNILSGALVAGRNWTACLFIAGVVTIFAGFLVHMAKLNLGVPQAEPGSRRRQSAQTEFPRPVSRTVPESSPVGEASATECPWKLAAMLLVAVPVVALCCWLPAPLYQLVEESTRILGGTP